MEQNQELQALSITDSLTGLFNRRVYDRELDNQIAIFNLNKQPFCLIILDIDLFKQINDNFGHESGDSVLVQFAQVLSKNMREIDTLARIGGEEFALVLPNTRLKLAEEVAQRHLQAIQAETFICGKVTASFGVAEISENIHKAELYTQADQALYYSKTQGRNQITPFPYLYNHSHTH